MLRYIVLALIAATPAAAQECVNTVDAYISLSQNYGEDRVVVSVLPDGRIIELWGNPETQTWSMMVTTPDGISCGVGSGVGYVVNNVKPNV
ncbi:MAG: hypothetical protein RI906_3341 [Pseudomonadota bacterium]|jgi:hypothetical protein